MKRLFNPFEHLDNLRQLAYWTLLVVPVGLLAGTASAFFLWSLEKVTDLRFAHGWLLFLLPAGGYAVGWVYHRLGRDAEGGNNIILEQIHEPGGGVTARMAPLVLLGTLITHLFGGSAGREGTAVQMGGSLASAYAQMLKVGADNLRLLLMAGVAAGFGSVFGTPLAGAIFAMEVLVIGRMQYQALIPVLAASLIGDMTCSAWGVHHVTYHIALSDGAGARAILDFRLLGWTVVASAAFGIVSQFFAELTHLLQHQWKKFIAYAPLRPVAGGAVVIALTYLLGTRDYLGLGVSSPDPHSVTIVSAFQAGGAHPWSWWWKVIFTAVTLSAGFKGGEVTPLFYIGATLGNAIAGMAGVPVDLFAGLGFIAVFSGASNTPLACTVMGIELFGSHYAVYFAVACFIAYYFSGHSGIYSSQRLGVPKRHDRGVPPELSLREARELRSERNRAAWSRLTERFQSESPFSNPSAIMKQTHHIVSQEMGKIRVYLTPREHLPAPGLWGKLNPKLVYREIIRAAKRDGLKNAMAYMTHHGYSNNGKVAATDPEATQANLTVCVEIIDHKDALAEFCRRHGSLLQGRPVIYKHVEQWTVHANTVEAQDASPNTVLDGEKKRLPSGA
ncbi:MAG TPA: DUF190 domain-containing protein [Opitutales bacterium]|nr:DUF190 domain-containing protein [Opitutales bacterium]